MSDPTSKPYKLGIALSGGGARGFAHVGALRAIQEAGLKPDVIAGVSAGAIVSTLFAAGVPFDGMLGLFADSKFTDFSEVKVRGGGLFRLDKFKKKLMQAIGPDYINLEDLPIKTFIGATDLDNGVSTAFCTGAIGERVIASCSIPIIFHPVTIDGVRYVDGGVLRNMPAWMIRDKCDYLIGINCSPLDNSHKFKSTLIDITMRSYSLMLKANQRQDMEMCDLAIETPEISGYHVFNLKEINQVYIRGYATAKAALKHAGLIPPTSQSPTK